tara:strand:+ start:44 stop:292 length:249 start_codon:yes stop_codon:yes gene_type:complete
MSEIYNAKLKKELGVKTYNITIKCSTYSDREAVLDIIDNGRANDGETLHEKEVIKYGDNSTVFFNEDYTQEHPRSNNSLRYL